MTEVVNDPFDIDKELIAITEDELQSERSKALEDSAIYMGFVSPTIPPPPGFTDSPLLSPGLSATPLSDILKEACKVISEGVHTDISDRYGSAQETTPCTPALGCDIQDFGAKDESPPRAVPNTQTGNDIPIIITLPKSSDNSEKCVPIKLLPGVTVIREDQGSCDQPTSPVII